MTRLKKILFSAGAALAGVFPVSVCPGVCGACPGCAGVAGVFAVLAAGCMASIKKWRGQQWNG